MTYLSRVYVMTGAERPSAVKIGYSRDPHSRTKSIYRCGAMQVHFMGELSTHGPTIERMAHHFLFAKDIPHEGGDWFTASVHTAIEAVQYAYQAASGVVPAPPRRKRLMSSMLHVRLSDEEDRMLRALRRSEPDVPTRSEMMRRLIFATAKQRQVAPLEPRRSARR